VCTAIQLPRISFPRRTCTSFFFGGATARGGPFAFFTIRLQASRSLDQSLSLSSFIPIFLTSVDTSSSHLIFGLTLRLVVVFCILYYIYLYYIYIFILYPPSPSINLSLFVHSHLSHVIQPSHFWSYSSSCCGVLHFILSIHIYIIPSKPLDPLVNLSLSLSSFIPIFLTSVDTSSSHLIFGLAFYIIYISMLYYIYLFILYTISTQHTLT